MLKTSWNSTRSHSPTTNPKWRSPKITKKKKKEIAKTHRAEKPPREKVARNSATLGRSEIRHLERPEKPVNINENRENSVAVEKNERKMCRRGWCQSGKMYRRERRGKPGTCLRIFKGGWRGGGEGSPLHAARVQDRRHDPRAQRARILTDKLVARHSRAKADI